MELRIVVGDPMKTAPVEAYDPDPPGDLDQLRLSVREEEALEGQRMPVG